MEMRWFRVLITIVLSWKLNACNISVMQVLPICGDGEEVWTVGYQNRTLRAVVFLDGCENASQTSLENSFMWEQNNTPIAYVGANDKATYAFSEWSTINKSHMISNLEMTDTLKTNISTFTYHMRHLSLTFLHYDSRTIVVKACPYVHRGVRVESSNYTYGSAGRFTCSGEVLVDIFEHQAVLDSKTECSTCAQWENMERMACWKTPSVKLKSNYKNKMYVSGTILTSDICEVIDSGKPNGSVFLQLNNSTWSTPITLKPYHNSLLIFCKMENQLTKILPGDEGLVQSEPYVLLIEFGPTDVLNQTTCISTDKKLDFFNMTVIISFSANPPFGNVTLSGPRNTLNSTTKLSNGSNGCCGVPIQQYRIVVANVTSQDRITFLYEHEIKNYSHNFSCADAIKKRPVVTTPVIIAVSGGILLIIAIVILCVLILRRRKLGASQSEPSRPPSPEGQGSEERLSVLYDTTDIGSSGNVGESVENVLYGSASGTTDVYAAVVKPKNKVGNSGETVENVLYGSATRETDVYAAVVKPKKKSDAKPTDLYAEVVKIKKKKKDFNADDPSVSEATYAAVNKKQKSEKSGKQHKEVDESLQLDQTYAVVDKNRKKK